MLEESIKRLRAYNEWRRGEDERTMDEAGIDPKLLGKDIDAVCDAMDEILTEKRMSRRNWPRIDMGDRPVEGEGD